MRWSVTIPGQPVSWDAAYRTGRMPVHRKGVQQFDAAGSPKMISRPFKTDEARVWQDDVFRLVINARPSGWRSLGVCTHGNPKLRAKCPAPQVRVIVDLILSSDMDDDNAMKLVRDAAAKAIGLDDMHFLGCTRSKTVTDDPRLASVTLTFDDEV